MMGRSVRLLALGFLAGAGAAFLLSLFRRQRLTQGTGYLPPVAAPGPLAVPDPAGPAAGFS
jgi:hypothetical protein